MGPNERIDTLAKIEELTERMAALAAAAKLIEGELAQLQATYYKQTAGVRV